MRTTKTFYALKQAVYTLFLLLAYVLQTTPGLFEFRGVKPVWVVPAAITIAMMEGEFIGGVYGALAGILCDMSGSSLFGYNGLMIALCCMATGLLVIYLLRSNLTGCLLFVSLTLLIRGSIEFLFVYGMWGFESVWKLYVFVTLPTVFMTLVVTPFLFYCVRGVFRKFERILHP